MKKFYVLFICVVFAAQYSLLSAQTTIMKLWKGGSVTMYYNTVDVDSVTFETRTENEKQYLGNGVYLINGHRFVDLGLPSGLLWAETNVGAETAADDGNYYAWAEIEPQSINDYSWESYKYAIIGQSGTPEITKYTNINEPGYLDKTDDAAYVNWGTFSRMPTEDDFKELTNSSYTEWTWTSMTTSLGGTIKGVKVTSTINGNSIFLPASGYRHNGELLYRGTYGYCWSSSHLNALKPPCDPIAKYFSFSSTNHGISETSLYAASSDYGLCDGKTIRPVAEP